MIKIKELILDNTNLCILENRKNQKTNFNNIIYNFWFIFFYY